MSTFLGLTHNPFTPPREGFFEGGDRKTHLEHLRHLSQWSRRVLVVTGPFGIGKSSLFRELSNSLEANTKAARLSGTVLTSEREVLAGLLQGFGISAASERHVEDLADQVLAHIAEQEGQKRVCMAMVDDAHLLDMRAVHRLVELVAVSGLRLLMFCEAGLVAELDRVSRMHELEWFEIRLTGLPKADVRDYLEWRFRQAQYRGLLPFTDEQLDNIVIRSGGNFSVIDSMANRLLGEMESGEIRNQKGGFPVMHAVLAVSLVVMVGLVYMLMQQNTTAPTVAQQSANAEEPSSDSETASTPPSAQSALPSDAATAMADGTPADQAETAQAEPIWADQAAAQSAAATVAGDPAVEAIQDLAASNAGTAPAAGEEESAAEREAPAAEREAPAAGEEPAATTREPAAGVEPPAIEQQAPVTERDAPEAAAPTDVQAEVAEFDSTPQPQAEQRYKDAQWLLRQNPQRFTLQLMTLSSLQRVREFIGRQDTQEEFAVYSMIRDGQRLYVVTYGVFSGRAAAQATAAGFSGELATLNPWVRPMSLVQDTVRDNPQN